MFGVGFSGYGKVVVVAAAVADAVVVVAVYAAAAGIARNVVDCDVRCTFGGEVLLQFRYERCVIYVINVYKKNKIILCFLSKI